MNELMPEITQAERSSAGHSKTGGFAREPQSREQRYELLMGQLIIIVIVGILIAVGSGFWVGKYVGYAQGTSTAIVEKPDYCSTDKVDNKIVVKCNELGNVSLDNLCQWASPELKNKIKLVLVTT